MHRWTNELMRVRQKRAFSLIEVVVIVGLAGLVGSIAIPRVKRATEFFCYRAVMQDLASTVRLMHARAVNGHQRFTMRIDVAAERLQLVVAGRSPLEGESVERTIWLPRGLDITQAPEQLTVLPTGEMLPSVIVVEAPAFQRTFRLRTSPLGAVQLHEEPST